MRQVFSMSGDFDRERGTESYKWAMHVKGLENPGYDARGLKTFALGLAVGTRGFLGRERSSILRHHRILRHHGKQR